MSHKIILYKLIKLFSFGYKSKGSYISIQSIKIVKIILRKSLLVYTNPISPNLNSINFNYYFTLSFIPGKLNKFLSSNIYPLQSLQSNYLILTLRNNKNPENKSKCGNLCKKINDKINKGNSKYGVL